MAATASTFTGSTPSEMGSTKLTISYDAFWSLQVTHLVLSVVSMAMVIITTISLAICLIRRRKRDDLISKMDALSSRLASSSKSTSEEASSTGNSVPTSSVRPLAHRTAKLDPHSSRRTIEIRHAVEYDEGEKEAFSTNETGLRRKSHSMHFCDRRG